MSLEYKQLILDPNFFQEEYVSTFTMIWYSLNNLDFSSEQNSRLFVEENTPVTGIDFTYRLLRSDIWDSSVDWSLGTPLVTLVTTLPLFTNLVYLV